MGNASIQKGIGITMHCLNFIVLKKIYKSITKRLQFDINTKNHAHNPCLSARLRFAEGFDFELINKTNPRLLKFERLGFWAGCFRTCLRFKIYKVYILKRDQ